MNSASERVKQMAIDMGFLQCGISRAEHLTDTEENLHEWLNRDYHGEMKWMENHLDKRLDTTKLVPGAKSVISVLFNYYPNTTQSTTAPKIAKYAYGKDYHYVLKDKLNQLAENLKSELGDFKFCAFVDSGPVMERQIAAKAGLGWIGKHSLLINKAHGSFFFIGQLICDLDLEPDSPVTDHCGTCTACIDACPTDAIVEAQVVDARKCISYLTIEKRGEIAEEFHDKMDGWAFGCDICQDVCPWNRFSVPHNEIELEAQPDILNNSIEDWLNQSANQFKKRFRSSPIFRTGNKGFKRNLSVIRKHKHGE